ncbi:MAG: hypothetical protein HY698_09250 [Deltaproteobacteria bacterium]|nr:hypothetical protein [Deltaproteobacteria bacterium]
MRTEALLWVDPPKFVYYNVRVLSRGWCLTVLAVFACSSGEGRPDAFPEQAGRTHGEIQVVLTVPRAGDASISTEARLFRFRDVDVEGAQVLAGATSPSLLRLPPGACVRVDGEALLSDVLARASSDTTVEMLDAGELMVRAAGGTVRLLPRYVPEIVPLVSGVLYESEGADPLASPPDVGLAEVLVSSLGGPDIGRFDTLAEFPPVPRITSLNGVDPAVALTLDRRRDLRIGWVGGGSGESPVIIFAWSHSGGGELRCRAGAIGHLVIRQAVLSRIPSNGTVQLFLEKSSVGSFAAPGLQVGEIQVSVRDAVYLSVI